MKRFFLKKLFQLLLVLNVFTSYGFTAIDVQVEITEVDHSQASRLGVDWLNQINIGEATAAGIVALGSIHRLTTLHSDLMFLIENGAAELLAKPNLITDSGTAATFHAGGQIPYITSSSLGTTNVEFKPFGVAMNITPKKIEPNRIEMKIKASVSAPDESNGVQLSGNSVPALFEREVTATVTVESGTTVTLAGLVQTQKSKTTRGVPFLRRIPLLGKLFQWERKRERRTSVVIFVTPKLVDI